MGVFTRDQPEKRSPQVLPYSAYRPLTAAATKLNINDKSTIELINKRRAAQSWQDDAWEYYDLVGEIKYAFRLFANVLSRVRLFAAYVVDEDSAPVPIRNTDVDEAVKSAVAQAMNRVFPGPKQPDLLRKTAVNMLVTGECYLVQLPPRVGVRDREQWRILSIDELVTKGGKYKIKTSKNQRESDMEELPSTSFVGRLWVEHPRYADEADSSMKGLIDLCDELFLFNRAARATARSRLNAGALFVPDSMSVSVDMPEVDVDDPNAPFIDDEDAFEQELLDAMTTPISDEGSAASVVPLLIRGPADAGDKIKLIKFERSFDPQLAQRAERALERILAGIDLPKDIVTGLANIKYSNAVQIEDQMYTQHVEPLVLLVCDALRAAYLEPALQAAGVDSSVADKIVIWYDPSAIMTAPDKSTAANVGFDKMALSWEAWRRVNGFSESDAPDEKELASRLVVSNGTLNDQVTESLLRTLLPDILDAARQQSIANSPAPLPPDVQQMIGGPGGVPKPPDDPTQTQAPGQPPPIVDPGTDATQPPPPVSGP